MIFLKLILFNISDSINIIASQFKREFSIVLLRSFLRNFKAENDLSPLQFVIIIHKKILIHISMFGTRFGKVDIKQKVLIRLCKSKISKFMALPVEALWFLVFTFLQRIIYKNI